MPSLLPQGYVNPVGKVDIEREEFKFRMLRGLRSAETVGPMWPKGMAEDTAESAWKFVGSCRTWNEAEAAVQDYPTHLPYLKRLAREWFECRKDGRPLVIQKTRRMVVSWLLRALELHQMGLRRQDCSLGGDDYEAAAKHVWRYQHLYDDLKARFPEWELPEAVAMRYEGDRKLKAFGLDNGSYCQYLNGQAENVQGEGQGIVTLEEFSIYRFPQRMLAQSKIVTQGSAKSHGGFVCCVGNASFSPEWHEIKGGIGDAGLEWEEYGDAIPGMRMASLPSGERFVYLEHLADPEKDAAWLERVRKEMESTPREFRLQILMDETAHSGEPVFGTYVDTVHAPAKYRTDRMLPIPGSDLFGGWDAGSTHQPAFVLAELTPLPYRCLRFMLEVVPYGAMPMAEFAPIVRQRLIAFLGERWRDVLHVGDPAGWTMSGTRRESPYGVARESGFSIKPVYPVDVDSRVGAMTGFLTDWVDESGGIPRVMFSASGCKTLTTGMRGAYCMQPVAGRDTVGPGMRLMAPAKNAYSHTADASMSICQYIRQMEKKGRLRLAAPIPDNQFGGFR